MILLLMLIVWALQFVSLMLAVLLLAVAYHLRRAELGLDFWPKETIVWMGLSAIQVGVFLVLWHCRAVGPTLLAVLQPLLAALAGAIGYRLAHRTTMKLPAAFLIAAVQLVISIPLWVLLLNWLAGQ